MLPLRASYQHLPADQPVDNRASTSSQSSREGFATHLPGLLHHLNGPACAYTEFLDQRRVRSAFSVYGQPGAEAAGEPGRQHLDRGEEQPDPVVAGHPSGNFNLAIGEERALMGHTLDVPGLFNLGTVGQPEHDPLDGPGSKRHPHQVPGLNVKFVRNAVSEGPFLSARAVDGDFCEAAQTVRHAC